MLCNRICVIYSASIWYLQIGVFKLFVNCMGLTPMNITEHLQILHCLDSVDKMIKENKAGNFPLILHYFTWVRINDNRKSKFSSSFSSK